MRRLPVVAVTGCQYPRDPDGTLTRVEGGVMRMGVTEADPRVLLEGDRPVGGAEVELAQRFARDVGARIEWVQGSEEELVDAAKEGQVDLIVGGLTSKSRWKKDVAFTRPYVETRAVVGIPAGESFPDDFAGVPVAAELGSEEEGHVFTGEVMVVPRAPALADGDGLVGRHEELAEHLLSLEWKVYDIVVVPVREIDIPSPGVTVGGQDSSAHDQDSSLSGSQ